MSNVTVTARNLIGSEFSTNPSVENVSVTTKDVEQSISVPSNTKQIFIRARNNAEIKFCFASGESGTKFITILKGCSYNDSGLLFSGTIYFQVSENNSVVEFLFWQ